MLRPDWSWIASSKWSYYYEKILQGCPDQKSLLTFLDKVYHRKQVVLHELLPAQLVALFNDYFVQRITFFPKDIDEQALLLSPDLPEFDTDEATSSFATFSHVLVMDVEKNFISIWCIVCSDPIPTWILKQYKDELLPTTTDIINHSLSSGKVSKFMLW